MLFGNEKVIHSLGHKINVGRPSVDGKGWNSLQYKNAMERYVENITFANRNQKEGLREVMKCERKGIVRIDFSCEKGDKHLKLNGSTGLSTE
jgi:hypothetical protein